MTLDTIATIALALLAAFTLGFGAGVWFQQWAIEREIKRRRG